GGASHGFLDGFKIGSLLDWEIDGNPTLNADGDDGRALNDEDGVIFEDAYLVLGQSESIVVDITNGENSAGVLQFWIDFNGDGVFNEDEQIVTNLAVAEGANAISFDVPADAVVGDTYARFRYAYERDLGPTGWTMAGEVEDYNLFISDDKPYAVDDVEVVTENSTNNIIEALANDIASPAGPLTITNITQGTEGGSVTIIGGGLKLAYTPAQGFTSPPFDTFTYTVSDPNGDTDTATVSVRVTPEFNDPTAVDDYFPFILGDAAPENLTWQPLDVLANDVAGVNGLALLPSNGAAAFPGLAEIEPGEYDTGNGCVRLVANSSGEYEIEYKPNDGFFDMDSFEYAAFDALGTETRANVTIQVQPNANANDEIKFTVEFPGVIGDVAVGETFTVQVSVDDDRSGMSPDDMGVFAAYMDLLYDSDLVSVVESTPTIVYDAEFPNGHSGNYDTPGIVNEVGAFQDTSLVQHDGPMTVYTITFQADSAGTVVFQTDPSDVSPLHDTLTIDPAAPVTPNTITFGSGAVNIVGSGEGESALDINADGDVTPLDALMIINDLNEHGTHAIGGGAEGEAVAYSRLDVNGDHFVSPIDALAVINYLNTGATLEEAVEAAEGEAMAVLDVALADEECLMMPTTAETAADTVASSTVDPVADNSQYQAAEQLALALWASDEVDSSDNPSEADALEDAIDEVASEISDFWNEA
ncbi:MAG: dockerin type I domain-containing protein, partial [Pirellulales bacterium]|nr:dockerin type I domain-containing protein [Pirellulales bacterium]